MGGGWCKRSHKHSYNAMSGVAIIIGAETRKILHIGVRSKYCVACARSIPPDKHKCYRNWNESSSQMETDIILEGFLEAERVHGVCYMTFIGDGDSFVHSILLERVFLDGAVPSRNLSVPIMPVSATEVRLKGSSRTTPPIRVMEVSLRG